MVASPAVPLQTSVPSFPSQQCSCPFACPVKTSIVSGFRWWRCCCLTHWCAQHVIGDANAGSSSSSASQIDADHGTIRADVSLPTAFAPALPASAAADPDPSSTESIRFISESWALPAEFRARNSFGSGPGNKCGQTCPSLVGKRMRKVAPGVPRDRRARARISSP